MSRDPIRFTLRSRRLIWVGCLVLPTAIPAVAVALHFSVFGAAILGLVTSALIGLPALILAFWASGYTIPPHHR